MYNATIPAISCLGLPPASACFLLGLLFEPEDGNDEVLRKADFLVTKRGYTPEDFSSHSPSWELSN
jgi:hypothetical protein